MGDGILEFCDAILRSSNASTRGSCSSSGSSYFEDFGVRIIHFKDIVSNIQHHRCTWCNRFFRASSLRMIPWTRSLLSSTNFNDGTDIAIPEGADFEFFRGDVVGVALGVDCLGDFEPKFQNE